MTYKKVILITGATGAIGACLAEHFSRAGYVLVLSGRSEEKLSALKEKIGQDTFIYPADISDYKSVRKLLEYVEKEIGRLNVVIPAAGIYGEIGSIEKFDPQKWEETFRVNVFGAMCVVKYAVPLLKKSKQASVIFIAGGGEGAMANFSAYVSSKGAILRLSETLASELAQYDINVNTISPGLINSGLVKQLVSVGSEVAGEKAYKDALAQMNGQMETITPDKACELCVFLASEKARGLTGKLFAARWDDLEKIEAHKDEIMKTDIYSSRRIKPKDRGYDW